MESLKNKNKKEDQSSKQKGGGQRSNHATIQSNNGARKLKRSVELDSSKNNKNVAKRLKRNQFLERHYPKIQKEKAKQNVILERIEKRKRKNTNPRNQHLNLKP